MLTYLGIGFLAVIVIGAILWAINSKYVKTWGKVAKANLGEAARDLEAANALVLMKQGVDDCADQVRTAKGGLTKVQSVITGLERQVKNGSTEEARLTNRVKQAITEGKADTDPVLVQLATSLKRVRTDLKTNKDQLEAQHGIYNGLLTTIQNAQRRAEGLEADATSLGAQLETSKLAAEMNDFANTFDKKGINQGLDGVAKYRDMVQKQIDQNNAKMKVNQDLGSTGTEVAAWEGDQDAKDIIAEMRAGNGA